LVRRQLSDPLWRIRRFHVDPAHYCLHQIAFAATSRMKSVSQLEDWDCTSTVPLTPAATVKGSGPPGIVAIDSGNVCVGQVQSFALKSRNAGGRRCSCRLRSVPARQGEQQMMTKQAAGTSMA